MVGTNVPLGIFNPTHSYSLAGGGESIFTLTFNTAIDFSQSRALVELYFDKVEGGSLYDHAVILPLGQVTYNSDVPIQSGEARLVNMATFTRLQIIDSSLTGNSISFTLPTSLEGKLRLVQLRYVPSTIPLSSLQDGMNGATIHRYILPQEATRGMPFFPRVPLDQEIQPPFEFGLFDSNLVIEATFQE